MKKSALVALGLSLAMCAPVSADSAIGVTVNGKALTFDAEPYMESDRVLVPLRAIFEALGCDVSYFDEPETVFAKKGTQYVSLNIGSDEMFLKDKTVKLDVPAAIKNDRTFVPVRAISEGMNAFVDWNNDTNTVIIETKKTRHTVKTEKIEKQFKADDGTVILNISCEYPQIENTENNSYIDELNTHFKDEALEFVKSSETETLDGAKEHYSSLGEGENWGAYEMDFTYDVDTDRNSFFGVTFQVFADLRGAHPSTYEYSEVYDVDEGAQLSLSGILNMDEAKAKEYIAEQFAKEIDKEPEAFFEDAKETLKKDDCIPEIRMTDTGIEAYLNTYKIAPYVAGIIAIEFPYYGNEDIFGVDLGDADVDVLAVTLDGNPTTGYTWEYTGDKSEKIEVAEPKYTPSETDGNIAGSGGTFEFDITGKKPGNCTAEFSYLRTFEGESSVIKKAVYNLYVTSDGKITVIDSVLIEDEK